MKKIISLICLLIAIPAFFVLRSGCNGENNPRIPKGNYIHLSKGKFTKYTKRKDISDMFEKIDKNTVVVHFHGGLVPVKDAYEKPMEKVVEGTFNKSMFDIYNEGAYPIFFIWESGFVETLEKMGVHKTVINALAEKIRKIILAHKIPLERNDIIIKFLTSVDVPSDGLENLLNDYNDVYNSWDSDNQNELVKALNDGIKNATEGLNNFMGENPREEYLDKVGSVVFYRVLQRTIVGRHHSLTATIQEEIWNSIKLDGEDIGKFLKDGWGAMKDISADAFQNDRTPQEGTYGGTAFLKELEGLVEKKPDIRVILIGHSAGAVYICNLLNDAARKEKYPLLNQKGKEFKFDVILEAPACTLEKFHHTIDIAGDKIRNFRMFTLGKKYEKEDELAPVAYSSSMLYFVSSTGESSYHIKKSSQDKPIYEYHDKPILGMERYLLNKRFDYDVEYYELEEVKKFLGYGDPTERIAFSRATGNAAPGWGITATTHGDCDNNVEVLKSLRHIIIKGFKDN